MEGRSTSISNIININKQTKEKENNEICLMILPLLNWSIEEAYKLWNISLNIESSSAYIYYLKKILMKILKMKLLKERSIKNYLMTS